MTGWTGTDSPAPASISKGGIAMRRICLANQKGGCGKTTTAITLSSCLAKEGRKVLLIDLDPQGHSGLGFGVNPDEVEDSIYEVLIGQMPMTKAVCELNENLDAVFSNVVLSAFEQLMAGAAEREYKLTRALSETGNNYDYAIIDCPPNLGLLTFNALIASDEIIIPVDSSFFSLQGLDKLLETIKLIEDKVGQQLPFKILATNVDRRTRFSKDVVENLRTLFGQRCFETTINICTRIREAASYGKPIDSYDKHCAAFRDYQRLTREIVEEEMEEKTFLLEHDPDARRKLTELRGKEVLFTVQAPGHANVKIAGDFNNWEPERLDFTELQGEAVWKTAVVLKPGTYRYKYLVDGSWIHDPENKETADDFLGGVNSVINV
jgi:chromosome partitioning protein